MCEQLKYITTHFTLHVPYNHIFFEIFCIFLRLFLVIYLTFTQIFSWFPRNFCPKIPSEGIIKQKSLVAWRLPKVYVEYRICILYIAEQ